MLGDSWRKGRVGVRGFKTAPELLFTQKEAQGFLTAFYKSPSDLRDLKGKNKETWKKLCESSLAFPLKSLRFKCKGF